MTLSIIKGLSDMAFILFLLFLSLGIGRSIWSVLFKQDLNPVEIIEEGIFSISLGLGVLSLLILIIGLSGFLYFQIVLIFLIIGFITFFKQIKEYISTIYNVYKTRKTFFSSSITHARLFWIISPLLILTIIWFFISSRIPPIFYDALVYHLGVPNQYIINHAIRFMPHSFHSHHPFLMQNLFALCLIIGGNKTPKLLVVIVTILNALALSLFSIRIYKKSLSWLPGIILLLTPTALISGSLVTVDPGFSLYTLLAFYALCLWTDKEEKRWLIISSMMAGLSLGAKYTAIVYSFGLILICLIFMLFKKRRRVIYSIKSIMLYISIALLISSGWYVKNYIWTKNPFYPQWADVWGNPKISEERLNLFHQSANVYNPDDPARNSFFSLPIDLIKHSEWFGIGGNIGPLFLFLLPLAFIAFLKERKSAFSPVMILYSISYFILWAFTFRMTRFALPLFAIFFLQATNTLDWMYHTLSHWIIFLICLLLIFGFSYNIYYSISLFSGIYDPWRYLIGKETEDAYLSQRIQSYPVFKYINENLPSDAKILFWGETINFYCLRKVIAPTAYDDNPFVSVLKHSKKIEDIKYGLKERGITYLLINFSELERLEKSYRTFKLDERDKKLVDAFIKSSSIIYRRGNILLINI